MNIELFTFQKIALHELRKKCINALKLYHGTEDPQVISFTAPTGSGKTIVATALIESILNGDEIFPEQPNAIIIWLSDSPELNQQSKDKVILKSNKINFNQCVTVTDDSFDEEEFQDGHIYFLNTQKLGKGSNLTQHSDNRTFTIWQTIQNTIQEKSDRLYCIIDEAHRGAKISEAGRATTIMQKFILGSEDDGLYNPLPLVIGMSATTKRFEKLVEGSNSTVQKVSISPESVRSSGLLKDIISIRYPSEDTANKDMAVFEAAVDDWKDKCMHWDQYCREQHDSQVNPVFVVQVENKSADSYSATELNDCVRTIIERTGWNFSEGEIVHAFGSPKAAITLPSIKLDYIEPSHIADDHKVRVVFFKDSLSTGWDCPRAETMMSFRRATDATYIAQLLGRMIRTPKQHRITIDETLNDVHLFLPHFDKDQVKKVVTALQDAEGADLPTDINGESIDRPQHQVLTVNTPKNQADNTNNEQKDEAIHKVGAKNEQNEHPFVDTAQKEDDENKADNTNQAYNPINSNYTNNFGETSSDVKSDAESEEDESTTLDRRGIMNWINEQAFPTYVIRGIRLNEPLKSLYKLLSFLNISGLNNTVQPSIDEYIINDIHSYVEDLKAKGDYEPMAKNLKELKLSQLDFDSFGESVNSYTVRDLFTTTDADIDRQFKQADNKLYGLGIGLKYGKKYYDDDDPYSFKVDFILYASDDSRVEALNNWCMKRYYELKDQYRSYESKLPENLKKIFSRLISDAEPVSEHSFMIPETISPRYDKDGNKYSDHLFVDSKTGVATFKLNTWEEAVLREEQGRSDFVCWIRNIPRASWALTIPYKQNEEYAPMYPDFLIIRKDDDFTYKMDILEPHNQSLKDNLDKAKGLAHYVSRCNKIGRVQLIRLVKISTGYKIQRLDLNRSDVRNDVLHSNTNDDLDNLFKKYCDS